MKQSKELFFGLSDILSTIQILDSISSAVEYLKKNFDKKKSNKHIKNIEKLFSDFSTSDYVGDFIQDLRDYFQEQGLRGLDKIFQMTESLENVSPNRDAMKYILKVFANTDLKLLVSKLFEFK